MKIVNFLVSLVIVVLFTACGGGNSSDSKTITTTPYTVVDPYIEGATFYWDKNNNGMKDSDEPVSSSSDASGNFTFNVSIPLGQKIVMLDKGKHNGVSYTGELSSLITNKKIASPLTTLEERYFKNKRSDLIQLLGDNGITIGINDIDSDPMKSNNIENIVATLAVDSYLKIDKFTNVDKNGTELGDIIVSVKDLIDLDISNANIEDTVSIMDFVVERIKEDGNLNELLHLKENFSYRKKLKDLMKNRDDKTKPGRISYINGKLVAKKAKENSDFLKNNIFSFDTRVSVNDTTKLTIDIDTLDNKEVSWSITQEPDASHLSLEISEDKKSVEFTPLEKGKYKIQIEVSTDTSYSKKSIEFSATKELAMEVSKVQGYNSNVDKEKLLGEVLNQSWVSSFIYDEAGITDIVNKYDGLKVIGYDETYGLLIEYDENNSTVKDNLNNIQYEYGIGNVYNRVYEGKDAFDHMAIYPNDNGKFDDGGTNWHLEAIHMPEAWEYSKGDDSFLIGVCDGGFDTKHQDLSGRFASILNYGDGGGNGDHGMAVTGTIGANTNNGIGISGINWNAKFVTSYMGTNYVKDVVETKQDGKEVRLVSNSWGYPLSGTFNPTDSYAATERFNFMQSVVAQRKFMIESKQDKLFLWAAGNGVGNGRSSSGYYGVDSKYDNGATHYTNNVLNKLDNLMVVAAFKDTGSEYVLTYYSNFGESVDIAAPTEFDSLKLNNGIYSHFGGTSAATPVASAVASLIMTINPHLTPKQVKKIMIDSATSFIKKRYVTPYSSALENLAIPIPILNAQNALKMAQETITPPDNGDDSNTGIKIAIDFMADMTDNFTPKATFTYYTFDKNYKIVSVNSTVKSSADGVNYNTYGNNSTEGSTIEVSLDPNNRKHEIVSVLTIQHIVTGETITQTDTQQFTYADMIITTKDAQSLLPIANADFKVFSNSIFKKYLVEGKTDSAGVNKIYLPYNMYNILGEKAGYKNSGAQSMIFEDKTYNITLLFGLSGTEEAGTISGIISDENSNPIDGATVEIFNDNISLQSTVSASNGYYQLTNIKKRDGNGALISNFVIKVTKTNYSKQERKNVVVLDGKERQENFSLIKIASNQPPTAIAGPDQVGLSGDTVNFTSAGSYDVDGNIVSYEWRENNTVLSKTASFSKSNLAVGPHLITLIVTDDDGAIGADSLNVVINKITTYNWIPEGWGPCSGNCGINGGTQTRVVNCKNNNGEVVDANFCTQTKPATTQSCTESLCNTTYYWKIGEWSACSGACGIDNGIQTRDVVCQDQNNFSVEESSCTTQKPETTQSCVTAKCDFDYHTITSSVTGRKWLDRNLGSSKVCTSINDTECFGSYYQWGREEDGHQHSSSATTTTLASSVKANHSDFIMINLYISNDWTTSDTNGVDRGAFWTRSDGYGICPNGFRIPSIDELKAENFLNAEDAFSKLKIPMAGIRKYSDGQFNMNGTYVWSNTPQTSSSKHMQYTSGDGHVEVSAIRGFGMSLRCINDISDANIPPIANIVVENNTTVTFGDIISFSGETSSDEDGYIVGYKWEDGSDVLSTSDKFSTFKLAEGTHTISLRVTDNKGDTDLTTVIVTVNPKAEYNWVAQEWGDCTGDCGIDNGTQTRIVDCRNSKNEIQANETSCTKAKPITTQNCTASYCNMDYGTLISPVTGRTWLDRNIGAGRECTTVDDTECYGDYFQWGRNIDSHEKYLSNVIDNISNSILPNHSYFIKSSFNYNFDWTIDDREGNQRVQNWSDINGNGVCPVGYRLPTKEELLLENITSSLVAYTNLKLPIAGYRDYNGNMMEVGDNGYIYTTSLLHDTSLALKYQTTDNGIIQFIGRGYANAINVRCIKAKNDEIILNKTPIANAGADQVITFGDTMNFDASQSYDTDGVIESYLWEKNGITVSEQSTFNISDLSEGTHIFKLTVTDDDGAKSTDDIVVEVTALGVNYNWKVGSWSDCSGACGNNNATQTRTVTCKDTSDNNVSDALCTQTKPTTSQACTEKLCVTFNEITSPVTGKVWMDRNLGAKQVCTSFNDLACFGDYYQWGRDADGHEKDGSSETNILSSNRITGTNNFILSSSNDNFDWLNNDANGNTRQVAWSITDGTGICPVGFRLPTADELNAEGLTGEDSVSKAFTNLKLPLAGLRDYANGEVYEQGYSGGIWSSTPNGTNSMYLNFGQSSEWSYYSRASGRSVRCIKDN